VKTYSIQLHNTESVLKHTFVTRYDSNNNQK